MWMEDRATRERDARPVRETGPNSDGERQHLATGLKPAVVRIAWRYRQRVRNCHPGVWVGRCQAGALGNGLDF